MLEHSSPAWVGLEHGRRTAAAAAIAAHLAPANSNAIKAVTCCHFVTRSLVAPLPWHPSTVVLTEKIVVPGRARTSLPGTL